MLKKSLLGLAIAAGSSSSVMAYDMKDLKAQCEAYVSDPQMKRFNMKVNCKQSFEDVIKESGEITIPNTNRRSASIKMKDWQTEQDTGISQGKAQKVSCNIYKKVEIEGPVLSFQVTECDQLTEEYVAKRCTTMVKESCKDGQCKTKEIDVVRNTCLDYAP